MTYDPAWWLRHPAYAAIHAALDKLSEEEGGTLTLELAREARSILFREWLRAVKERGGL
jgi:hypothetical protein